jgi:hypothetical protein
LVPKLHEREGDIMTDWTNADERESAIAAKWSGASAEVDRLKAINAELLGSHAAQMLACC